MNLESKHLAGLFFLLQVLVQFKHYGKNYFFLATS